MPIGTIREFLNSVPKFWNKIHRSLDQIGFTQDYVDSVVRGALPGHKYFKDNIWGMIEFGPDELAIIDSPLLQRLRRIHQLGFTFLTYPSAEHSRFSHTLGVAHVVKRLIASIAEVARQNVSLRAAGEEYAYYNPTAEGERLTVRSLFHAALLHDCGHIAFSHAGEAAFRTNVGTTRIGGVDLEDFLQIFRDASFESGLSECLSIVLCLSPRFHAFYSNVIGPDELERRINEVCLLIGGMPHQPAYPGLANIISGAAVDADKIDYINRDARQCGIPVGVDVSRVFLNSALININATQARKLSRSLKEVDAVRFVPGWHFIVNSTGVDTYDELANAKSILYNRVYLHQLTRNAEQVLSAAIDVAIRTPAKRRQPPSNDVFSYFEFGDSEFLAKLSASEPTAELAQRLITRRLPKRAFVLLRDVCEPYVTLEDVFDSREWIGPDGASLLEDLDAAYERQTAWKLFDRIIPADPDDAPLRVRELRSRIREEAISARQILDRTFDRAALRSGEPYVGFSARHQQKPIPEVLVREKNSIGFSSQWSKSDELTTADSIGRSLDYFYADREWFTYVAMACVKVLYDFKAKPLETVIKDGGGNSLAYDEAVYLILPRLKLRLESICSRVGLEYSDLTESMIRAAAEGYFAHAERTVPLDLTLLRRCGQVARKFDQLQGERGWRISEQSVESFVRQFPVVLRAEVFALLDSGQMLGRGLTRAAIDTISRRVTDRLHKPLLICRFSPNSGNFVGMILEQKRRDEYLAQGHRFARNLAELKLELAKDPNVCILFVDDQFATGGQAHAQLLQWAEVPRNQWPEELRGEQNIDNAALGAKAKELFANGQVVLAFIFGTTDGRARIKEAAASLGFNGLYQSSQ
jgi:HD superfamily phosphohydrolase